MKMCNLFIKLNNKHKIMKMKILEIFYKKNNQIMIFHIEI